MRFLEPFISTAPNAKHSQPDIAEHAFFYFRDPSYLNQLQDAPHQLLCTFTDEGGLEDETMDERQQRERARDALQKLREETIPQDKPVIYQADWRTELSTPELALPLESTDEWRKKWNRFAHLSVTDTDEHIPADQLAAANAYNAALPRGRLSNFRLLAVAREQSPPGTETAVLFFRAVPLMAGSNATILVWGNLASPQAVLPAAFLKRRPATVTTASTSKPARIPTTAFNKMGVIASKTTPTPPVSPSREAKW